MTRGASRCTSPPTRAGRTAAVHDHGPRVQAVSAKGVTGFSADEIDTPTALTLPVAQGACTATGWRGGADAS